jgi:phage shock protein E
LNSFVTSLNCKRGASPQTLLVDERSGTEFAGGHIPGAVNIAMDEVEARLSDIDADLPILLVC